MGPWNDHDFLAIPSHLAKFETLIGSLLGGSSLTASLGAKFLCSGADIIDNLGLLSKRGSLQLLRYYMTFLYLNSRGGRGDLQVG